MSISIVLASYRTFPATRGLSGHPTDRLDVAPTIVGVLVASVGGVRISLFAPSDSLSVRLPPPPRLHWCTFGRRMVAGYPT